MSNERIVLEGQMAADDCPPGALEPILRRLQLDTLATPSFYRRELNRLGLGAVSYRDEVDHLAAHYQRVLDETERRPDDLRGRVSDDYLRRMKTGLQHWIEGGRAGRLAWGIFHART